MTSTTGTISFVRPFSFESYGVFVTIRSNQQEIVDQAAEVAVKSLLGEVRTVGETDFDYVFDLPCDEDGLYFLFQNGKELSSGDNLPIFFKFFDSILRVAIGEYAADRVFLHAGVVAWNGKAIVLPADSYQGKSTLVSELVRNGAEYYSDEFAIIDRDGFVHPFARRIGMRTDDYKVFELTVEDLGGTYGAKPIPIGMVLLTGYRADAKWKPEILTQGNGILKIIPFALSIRYRTNFVMEVLHKVASRAIIASSLRGSADKFAKTLLDFVDNNVN